MRDPASTRTVTRRTIVRALVPVYLTLIVALPLVLAAAPTRLASSPGGLLAASLVSVAIFCLAYITVAGMLSRITLRSIVPGKFPRDLGHEVYGPRRLYALCWTAIYYCPPVYHAILAVPALKRLTYRLFGYRGSLDFQTYPDTWVRDLPLLEIGKGAYLSNKATISPNMCLRNGKIIVMPVRIGARTMIGHLTMIAPGVEIGNDAEIGVGASIGLRVRIGSKTHVDHIATVDHESVVGDQCVIGTRAYIGRKAVIGEGVRVPPGAVVPANAVIESQRQANALVGQGAGTPAGPVAPVRATRPPSAAVTASEKSATSPWLGATQDDSRVLVSDVLGVDSNGAQRS